MSMELRGTTICAVRKNGHTSIAGDGQVTMGQSVIFKSHAHKVRRLYGGQVVIGFAGAVADAFTLCDKFEEKLTQCGGNLERAAVALAQMWRSDSGMRQLETQMIVADKDTLLVVSGTGEVIDPDEGVVAIGSGGNYALAAARALVQNTDLSAHDIAEKALHITFGTKESTNALRAKAQKNGNPLEAFKALFQNDQLLWVALSYLLYAIANVATTGVLLFLFKFVLDNQAAYSMTGVIALVAGLIMAPLYPILNKRIPRRVLYIVGMTSMIVAYILLGLFSTNMTVVFIALVLFYIPGTLIQMTAILSLTDSIEYGQLKNGKRNEAVTLSVRPMLDKIAGACSNGIVGAVAIAAGMIGDATAADMTPSNIHTFEICAFYVPLAVIILSGVVFLLKVKISEKMHADIVEQLETQLNEG